MVDDFKRQTAYVCTVKQLVNGTYVRRDGYEPSFMATSAGAISRARIAGVVTSASAAELVLDDGSGVVSVRSFNSGLPKLSPGSFVLVIGRPRSFDDQTYVMAECVHKLSSPAWLLYYKNNLALFQSNIPPVPSFELKKDFVVEEEVVAIDNVVVTKPVSTTPIMLIDIIRELDPGDGAPVDEVLAKAGPDAEERLQLLIREGEVFELRAGKVKVLE